MKTIIRKVLREHLNEVRVPRKDRIQLYKDNNIVVVVPLTHDALRKYATNCLWCINSDKQEWAMREGQSVLIIQRNPVSVRIGISGVPTNEEIYALRRWDEGRYSKEDIENILDHQFSSEDELKDYYEQVISNIRNFDMNTVFYSRGEGTIDKGNNYLGDYGFGLRHVPHINDMVINTINKYLREAY